MQIKVGYELVYDCPAATPMIATLNVHFSRASDLVMPDHMLTSARVPINAYRDSFGNWCSRLVMPRGETRLSASALVNDSGLPDVVMPHASQSTVDRLPEDTLLFLLGSRYCETDRLTPLAWQLFGQTAPGWPRVQAICNYVHNHLTFGYQFARPTKTAWDAHQERNGVCRDFAHLALTLVRCMNIPARYCTGYLGDIGVPHDPAPMDFAGWFEAYLDGQWFTFDARHNTPRIGRVLIARGRDAADVAITTVFGPAVLKTFKVWTDEVVV
jgi:transglutaminase-like putative cysteine protease